MKIQEINNAIEVLRKSVVLMEDVTGQNFIIQLNHMYNITHHSNPKMLQEFIDNIYRDHK